MNVRKTPHSRPCKKRADGEKTEDKQSRGEKLEQAGRTLAPEAGPLSCSQ